MSLQNPGALLWFLPLAGIIVALYLLKMRRREVRVPASFLWPDRVDEVRANSLFQRLRFSWLLVLQLLAAALVVLALARPQTQQFGLTGEVTVIVLDASASMGATDVRPTRFEEAKRQTLAALDAARAGDRIAVVEAGAEPRVVFSLTNDPARRRDDVRALRATAAEGNVGAALRLAAALVKGLESARILVLSDGAFPRVEDFSAGKASVVYRQIGTGDANLAVRALGVAETPTGQQAFVGIRNTGSKSMAGVFTLRADGKTFDSVRLTVEPGKEWGRTVPSPPRARTFEAVLEAEGDLLAADNYAAAVSDPNATLRVLLVSAGNPFLERALTLDPRVTLDRAAAVPDTEKAGGPGPGTYDVVVFDGVAESAVKARGVLTFGAAGPSSPVVREGTGTGLRFVSAEADPLVQDIGLERASIERFERVRPKDTAQVLVAGRPSPIVVASRTPKRQVYVAFEPLQSDYPLDFGFPIFLAQALDFLAGGAAAGSDLVVRTGQTFAVSANSNGTLTSPDGSRRQIARSGANLVLRDLDEVGAYRLRVDGAEKRIFAQMRSETESSIAPQETLALGGGRVAAVANPARFADFWRPILLLLLAVFAVEWWLYARRS